jgi:alkaline phosphatase D
MITWSRRQLLRSALGAGALAALDPPTGWSAAASKQTLFPFGIASGFPTSASVVLWTRVAIESLAPGGGLPQRPIEVRWQLSADDSFRDVIASGTDWALPQYAHSVHVEPSGLDPGRDYWYRFEAQGQRSPVGRTRTAAAPGTPLASLRAALVCCQHYEHGEWAAYRHLASSAPDLVVHLGDYIYESSMQRPPGRRHVPAHEAFTLDDYRLRYSQYKLDPALQAAHAVAPWLVTWDDHEVENDYADDLDQDADPPALFLQRRAAAYQAYYENMPVPRRAVPFGPLARLYTDRIFGDLLSITLLDGRQYRSHGACLPPGRGGALRTSGCRELFDASRTMLGATQEAWLGDRLKQSRARWNVIAQGTPMAYIDQDAGAERLWWTDAWAGYPAARDRLMSQLLETRVSNPLVVSGDVHAFGWSELRAKTGRDDGPVVAPELITTSISSNAVAQSTLDQWPADSPELKHIDGTKRGYTMLTLTHRDASAQLIAVDDQRDPASACRVIKSLSLESGRATYDD